MKVLLVGDDPGTLRRLKSLVETIDSVTFAAAAETVAEAERAVDRLEPDVVLFDVETKGGVGASRAHRLLGKVRPELIFVSARDEFVREALDLDAAGYLRKPVRLERLGAAMSRV
ncbi:response regulator, partial [bacterium]